MNEGFEWLIEVEKSHIAQCFADETGIQEMHRRVFRSADVFIDRAHMIDEILVKRLAGVLIVRVTELIPR